MLLAALGGTNIVAGSQAAGRINAVQLDLRGGQQRGIDICGLSRRSTVARQGQRVLAVVKVAGRRPSRRPAFTGSARDRRRVRLTIERCQGGRWVAPRQLSVGFGPGRHQRRLDTTAVGDYRVTAAANGRRSAARYLRVGVGEIVNAPVNFAVTNLNRSGITCEPFVTVDGKRYPLRAHLVGPRSALRRPARAATIYVHGGFTGEPLWHLQGARGYDHVWEMAKLGHLSLSLDLLGYGRSGLPHGSATCPQSDADVVHQVIRALRSGSYRASGESPTRFRRLAIAGLSFGAFRAIAEAAWFGEIDALVQMAGGPAPAVPRPGFVEYVNDVAQSCRRGGRQKYPGGPGSYTDIEARKYTQTLFHNADPQVIGAFLRIVEPEPCGAYSGGIQNIFGDIVGQSRISVPVLVLWGENDEAASPYFPQAQPAQYPSSNDVTGMVLKDTGHLIMFSRTAPIFRATLSSWLRRRGF